MTKILIVEDENPLAEEFADWLQFEDYEVLLAHDGKAGLEIALRELPDLIISDIMMPIMSGTQLLYALRAHEVSKMTPFIFLTALSEREHVRNGMILGADDYVSKPVRREELLKAIETRLKRYADTEEYASKSLSSLRHNIISHLPHELRTPLNSIIGFGSLLSDLAEGLSSEEVSEMGKAILQGGTRLHRLIENYLLFIQIDLQTGLEAGSIEAERLEAVCFDAAFALALNYNRKNELKLQIQPASITISEVFLRKVLHEIIDNAFRFSESPAQVGIQGEIIDDNTYQIVVHDSGIGINPAYIKKIGAFMQFDRDKNEQQGSGLGLVICQRMLEIAGGSLDVKSEIGQWTKVILKIPLLK